MGKGIAACVLHDANAPSTTVTIEFTTTIQQAQVRVRSTTQGNPSATRARTYTRQHLKSLRGSVASLRTRVICSSHPLSRIDCGTEGEVSMNLAKARTSGLRMVFLGYRKLRKQRRDLRRGAYGLREDLELNSFCLLSPWACLIHNRPPFNCR